MLRPGVLEIICYTSRKEKYAVALTKAFQNSSQEDFREVKNEERVSETLAIDSSA